MPGTQVGPPLEVKQAAFSLQPVMDGPDVIAEGYYSVIEPSEATVIEGCRKAAQPDQLYCDSCGRPEEEPPAPLQHGLELSARRWQPLPETAPGIGVGECGLHG